MKVRDLIPRIVRVSPEMRETNAYLAKISASLDRIAAALDRAIPFDEPELTKEELEAIKARETKLSRLSDEQLAAIELMEQSGQRLPDEVYEYFGLDLPDDRNPDDPLFYDEEIFDRMQPGTESDAEDEIRVARRDLSGFNGTMGIQDDAEPPE